MAKYTSKFTGIEIDERLSKVNEEFTREEKEKLAALENYDDSEILAAVEDKVDKVEGKGLSTNDFTDEEKNKLSALENYDDSGITKSIEDLEENKANKSEVYNKEETDTKITEKVAEIVAGAPEEFNTLKEMSDWLTEHEDSAATMNTTILKNKEDIADNATAIEENTAEIANNKSDILKADYRISSNENALGYTVKNLFNINGDINRRYDNNVLPEAQWKTTVTDNIISFRVPLSHAHLAGQVIKNVKGKKIIVSGNFLGIESTSSADRCTVRIYKLNNTTPIYEDEYYNEDIGEFSFIVDCYNCDEILVSFGTYHNVGGVAKIENLMVRYADITDDTYEPYKPSVNERLTVNEKSTIVNQSTIGFQSKNILPNVQPSTEYEGITYTVNADKSITCNGTTGSTASYFSLNSVFTELPNNIDVVLSGCPAGGSQETYALQIYEEATPNSRIHWNEFGEGLTGKLPKTNNGKYKGMIVIRPNQTVENLTFKPMLRYAGTDDTYEPYKPSVNERLVEVEESVSELTPQVEQNKSDILKVQRHSATMGMHSQGWYRIAECVIGQGRSAILRLERTYGNNPTEIITLLINVAYNVASVPFFDCNILDKYVKSSLLKKLRIVIPTELSVSSKMYIDVWNDGTSANGLKTTIFGESVLSSSNEPITILNPTIVPELTDEYTTKQFDLTEGDVFDRLKNLKDLLSKLHGAVSYPVTANGSFTAGGATENITNRIRTDIIPVKAGDVIEIVNGSLLHGCGIWKGAVNSTNNIRNDNGPKNTNENVIIEYDGNIVITFLHTSQKDLSLDDFDGSVTLYRKST